jgi:acyl-CoA synthetase (NDP forming)
MDPRRINTSLTAPEGKPVCDARGGRVLKDGVAKSASEVSKIATDMGFPVVVKIVSPDSRPKSRSQCSAPNTNGRGPAPAAGAASTYQL